MEISLGQVGYKIFEQVGNYGSAQTIDLRRRSPTVTPKVAKSHSSVQQSPDMVATLKIGDYGENETAEPA